MFIRTADRQQGNTHSPMADPTDGGGSAAQSVSAQPAQPVSAQPDTLQISDLTVQYNWSVLGKGDTGRPQGFGSM